MNENETGGWGRVANISLCLFLSGLCALVYQTVWLREFRLIFGASTLATAAVLAIFMGGVGAGSIVLGKKVDALGNSFRRYAHLEVGIAATAALTPVLFWLVRQAYIGLGGTTTFGLGMGTVIRLALASLVLLAPTFLMGGTLPAAVRVAQSDGDVSRRRVALLYGANTCGAVTGALLSTFFLFEHLGNRLTLLSACAANFFVATLALWLSQRFQSEARVAKTAAGRMVHPGSELDEAATAPSPGGLGDPRGGSALTTAVTPRAFIFAAAAVTGFAFFLIEIVWYRMLGPLLGGSTFTFGLILALALAGIAAGSLGFSFFQGRRQVTVGGFALVCALEAMFIAAPYALGDRVAVLTILLQPIGSLGFAARVAEWSVTASIVVLPGSVMAGMQFPMLIALLGRGRTGVGAHTGLAYGWNTAGAIAGSLAGGFGLLPLLSAPGAWKLVVILLVTLSFWALWLQWRATPSLRCAVGPVLTGAAALAMLLALGPTAVWRHSPIGAGRVRLNLTSLNDLKDFANKRRRDLLWEADGRESSVGLASDSGFAFVVNGKIDGNVRGDAGTQVMLGLLGSLIHREPREALVVGLGTGATAGWLADVAEVERVDVLELEPVIERVARDCAPANRNVLANPKVHIWHGDAREAMLTSRRQYALIASEPSNPYRAGVASLYTKEFYEAAAQRLLPDGLFAQWVQSYEIDGETVGTIYATLNSVFPYIETWCTQNGDLTFIACREPVVYDLDTMRRRLTQEPYRTALASVWRMSDVEGIFGHYVGRSILADAIVANPYPVNTDDRNCLEFAFARTVGRKTEFEINQLVQTAHEEGYERPEVKSGKLDWAVVCDHRVTSMVVDGKKNFQVNDGRDGFGARTDAKSAFGRGEFVTALNLWRKQSAEPDDLLEILLVAQGLAEQSDTNALRYIDQLRPWLPIEADAVAAQLYINNDDDLAFAFAEKALIAHRTNPWPRSELMTYLLSMVLRVATQTIEKDRTARLAEVLGEPFAVGSLEQQRLQTLLAVTGIIDARRATHYQSTVIAELEPYIPWNAELLRTRMSAYRGRRDAMTARAEADWAKFSDGTGKPLIISTREQMANATRRGIGPGPGMTADALKVQARER